MQRISITNPQNIIDGTAKKYYFKLRNTGGPKGDKGEKGDTGQTGPQGPKGDAATVAVGSTTTLPVGYDATVENVGSLYNAVLNFGIPQGPQGPQGIQGERGVPGQTGQTGPRGPQGERGTNATVYIGTTTTLNPGSQATVYNSGTDSNAVLNFGIPKGEKGDTGPMPTIAQTTGQAIDQVMSQKATTDALNAKQATIDSSHKLSADLVDDTSTTNKFVTAQDKTAWNAKQDALTAGNNIDIEDGVISTPAIAPEVVAELPATGTEGKLYLTPKAHTTTTATGNPITATVSEDAGAIESFQLDGDTEQQSYTGKNLCGLGEVPSGSTYGVVATIDESSNSLTLNGTYNGGGGGYPWISDKSGLSIPAGTYTLSIKAPAIARFSVRLYRSDGTYPLGNYIDTGNTSTVITTDFTCVRISILFGSFESGQVFNNYKIENIQLESGSSATSFEPFVGGTPSPNPDYPQPIQTVTGEQTVTIASLNLFDGIFEIGNISTTTGTDINADTMIRSKNYAVIEGGENYTISVVGGGNVALRFYQSDGTFIGTGTTGQSPNTFTAPANAGRVRFVITSNTNLSTKAQCEKGNSATDWTPYFEPSNYPIDLGNIELCGLGDDGNGNPLYKDRIYRDGNDWKIHKATNTKVYDGTTNKGFYYRANTNVSGKYRFQLEGTVEERSIAQSSSTTYFDGLCNEAPAGSRNLTFQIQYLDGNAIAPRTSTGYGNIGIVYLTATSEMTLAEANTWLTTHNMVVTYALKNPTDTVITDTALIAQLEAIRTATLQNGTNTITNTATGDNLAGDMEIGYYGFAPRNRYDKWLWLDINNEYEQIGS